MAIIGGFYRQLCIAIYVKHPGLQTSSRQLCRPVPHAIKVRNACQRIIAWGGRATVLGPGRQVRQIAEARAEGLVLLVNAQWQGGQAISDFGVGPWRRRTEAFVASFVEVYSLRQFRIFGDNVRRARGPVRVAMGARPASERRGVFACVVLSSNMRRLSVISQGVASMKKARCVHVWQLPLTSSGCKERAWQWGKSWIAGLSWCGAGVIAASGALVYTTRASFTSLPRRRSVAQAAQGVPKRLAGLARARWRRARVHRDAGATRGWGEAHALKALMGTCMCSGRRAVDEPRFQKWAECACSASLTTHYVCTCRVLTPLAIQLSLYGLATDACMGPRTQGRK